MTRNVLSWWLFGGPSLWMMQRNPWNNPWTTAFSLCWDLLLTLVQPPPLCASHLSIWSPTQLQLTCHPPPIVAPPPLQTRNDFVSQPNSSSIFAFKVHVFFLKRQFPEVWRQTSIAVPLFQTLLGLAILWWFGKKSCVCWGTSVVIVIANCSLSKLLPCSGTLWAINLNGKTPVAQAEMGKRKPRPFTVGLQGNYVCQILVYQGNLSSAISSLLPLVAQPTFSVTVALREKVKEVIYGNEIWSQGKSKHHLCNSAHPIVRE